MKNMTNEMKEKYFRFPGKDFVGFSRKPSCVKQGGALWIATQKEDINGVTLVVVRDEGGKPERLELPVGPLYHAPVLVECDNGAVPALAWNQFENGSWSIKYAELCDKPLAVENIETVYSSERLCMPPSGVVCGDAAQLAWPAVDDDRVRIFTAVKQDGEWQVEPPVSGDDVDALRPCMCVANGAANLFWDQYKDGRYEIAGATRTDATWSFVEPTGHPDEHWFCPNIATTAAGVYVTWVVMKKVADDLGIVDNHAFIMFGKLNGNRIEIIEDRGSRVVADLREGLLAVNLSKGYVGLRRWPQLSVDSDDRLWLCWEVRIEEEGTAVSGYLAARSFDGEEWSEPRLLADPGYGYTLPKKQDGSELVFGYYKFAEPGLDVIRTGTVAGDAGSLYVVDESRWSRWHRFDIEPLVKSNRVVEVDGKAHKMFWADTHCHCNVSADVEGEPDEIIHYGRDIAGLDAMCLIDNDFYPHKTLSPAEWQMHQENSRRFTKNGKFVLFPGYEFTYHRKDMSPYPDFNHRCVIYPGPGGKLHRRIDPGTDSDYKLLEALKDTDAMCYPHHSSYKLIDEDRERNVEVCSSWRTVLEENDFTVNQLKEGKKLGFIGSSDAHRSNPGLGGALTGLFAPELTPEALFDAYNNRRIIATQGFAVFIDFRVAGLFIGSEGLSAGAPEITAEIEAPKELEYVRILRDGEEIHRVEPGSNKCSIAFRDESAEEGKHFYFLNLKLVGEPGYNGDPSNNSYVPFTYKSKYPHNLARARGVFAWTSPVWVAVSN